MADISVLNFGDSVNRNIKDASSVHSISVNGVPQTVSNNATDLDISTNLIPASQWTNLSTLWSTS